MPAEAIEAAAAKVDPKTEEALKKAAKQIREFHERQVKQSWFSVREDGALVGAKVTPLESVGIYVPGGRALYPSTVLMNALPAAVAGVERIVCVTPPTKDGSIDPVVLEACRLAGVTEIYTVGGAQAVAALAYGTETIEPVCKITGPGNAFVAAAKKIVSGDVGIDMIAGPSEVCVVADETADPAMVAIDLMAQAEHDPLASCYLVTFDEGYADKVEAAIEGHMKASTRAEITTASLADQGLVVICDSMEQAIQSVNVIAPEHLELHFDGAFEQLGAIRNAGAIFVGEWTPEAVGDYVAGPNHTLPTGGTARYASPLSTDEFVKHSSVIQYSREVAGKRRRRRHRHRPSRGPVGACPQRRAAQGTWWRPATSTVWTAPMNTRPRIRPAACRASRPTTRSTSRRARTCRPTRTLATWRPRSATRSSARSTSVAFNRYPDPLGQRAARHDRRGQRP